MAVFLDGDAAAGCVHHNRLHRATSVVVADQWPPSVDIDTHVGFAALLVVQVELDRAAAASFGGDQRLNTCRIQHATGGGVDVG